MNQRILAWDLESSYMTLAGWGLWDQNFGLDQILEAPRVLCFGAMWLNEKPNYTFKSVHHHGREEMLNTIHDMLSEATAVVSWNGRGYDTGKIQREFAIEEMTPPAPWMEVDLMRAVKQTMRFPSNKLDWVAKELVGKEKVKHEGMMLWRKAQAGDEAAWRKFKVYQKQDVVLLKDLYARLLPWIPASMHPNLALGSDLEMCPRCQSVDLEKRGFKATSVSIYQQYLCRTCGHWSRAAKRDPSFSSILRG